MWVWATERAVWWAHLSQSTIAAPLLPPATNCSVRLRALSANGELGRHTSLSLSHWSCSKRQLLSHWLFDQSHIVLVWYIQTQRTKEEDQEMRDNTIIPFLTKALFKFETACTRIDAMILDGIKMTPYRWLILKCKEVVPPRRLCYTWRDPLALIFIFGSLQTACCHLR